jgi:hypothetical protein
MIDQRILNHEKHEGHEKDGNPGNVPALEFPSAHRLREVKAAERSVSLG